MCFNPLHCGAVVASVDLFLLTPSSSLVSIPFIAGQWSLLLLAGAVRHIAAEFQSPSLRGSGRFRISRAARGREDTFQSPSLRGSGRFVLRHWIYPDAVRCFNPLHCGAVVASL